MNKKTFIIISFFVLSACNNYGQLDYVTKLPKTLKENSGIAFYKGESVWFVEDNGNSNNIYQVNFKGDITKKLEVKNAKNHDWEDLTKDNNGNLYIGDFGNNDNDRKNLIIYKLPNPQIEKGGKIKAKKITFNYPEQKDFPPKHDQMYFDAEALFYHADNLYIFTKNRSKPYTGEAFIYKVPAKKGDYEAKLVGKITTCSNWDTCRITSAAISPNGKTITLLGYGKLWLLSNYTFDDFSKSTIKEIDLSVRTQLEAVCFKNDTTLLLSDEKRKHSGGNLYSFEIEQPK